MCFLLIIMDNSIIYKPNLQARPLSPGSPVMSGPIRIKPEKNLRLLVVAEAGFALGPKGRFACEELRPGAREED